jgi:hypothetical protein
LARLSAFVRAGHAFGTVFALGWLVKERSLTANPLAIASFTMMLAHAASGVLFAALSNTPVEHLVVDMVDVIEVNHCHDEDGKHVFDQIIFYDWSPTNRRYQVRAWRLLKEHSQYPSRNVSLGLYESLWHDGMVLRQVQGKTYRETWTQFDPELAARQFQRKEDRRQLTSPQFAITRQSPVRNSVSSNTGESTRNAVATVPE